MLGSSLQVRTWRSHRDHSMNSTVLGVRELGMMNTEFVEVVGRS